MTLYLSIKQISHANKISSSSSQTSKNYIIIRVQKSKQIKFKISNQAGEVEAIMKHQYFQFLSNENQFEIILINEDIHGTIHECNKIHLNKTIIIQEQQLKKFDNLKTKAIQIPFTRVATQMQKQPKPDDILHIDIKYDKFRVFTGRISERLKMFDDITKIQISTHKLYPDQQPKHRPDQNKNFSNTAMQVKHTNEKIPQTPIKNLLNSSQQTEIQMYLGPCKTRNIFSCMDQKISDQQKFTIYEHEYNS